MSDPFGVASLGRMEARPLFAAALGGLACAFPIGKMLPVAMERLGSAPPFAVRDLGRLLIRGRADGIDAPPQVGC